MNDIFLNQYILVVYENWGFTFATNWGTRIRCYAQAGSTAFGLEVQL